MENNQSIKHELNQVKRPKAVLKSSKSVAINGYKIFIYLLTRHPLLLLAGVFTTVIGTASLSLYSLVHVSDVEQLEAEPVPAVVEQPIITNAENSDPLPMWMVVAIALSCASGCLVIFRLLNPPTQRPQVQKWLAISHQVPSIPSRAARKQQPVIKPHPIPARKPTRPPMTPMQAIKNPIVAVMSAEPRNPFEESRESLVDLLDWRKHNSLTSILQQYSS
ncbi:hypothetical protein [Nostoc sp. MS1]|uniref:hypothetical protein n=1 Tax=Nostoc sp. MS1 TaxID=2764711 RepID=UPI001CC43E76|nr:hypothetical protein [Nostoc sp. MS1]